MVTRTEQDFTFAEVAHHPIPSLLRGFSAPVKLSSPLDDADLDFLMRHDADLFNRWQAAQTQAMKRLVAMARGNAEHAGCARIRAGRWPDAHRRRAGAGLSRGFRGAAERIGHRPGDRQPMSTRPRYTRRGALRARWAIRCNGDLKQLYEDYATTGAYEPDPESVGSRRLRNTALALLAETESR